MRAKTLLLLMLFAAGPLLSAKTPLEQIDQDGRAAYNALRDFEHAEALASVKQGAWPTSDQHRIIIAKLDIAYEGVKDSLSLGNTLVPGAGSSPQVRSLLLNASAAVGEMTAQVTPLAPLAIRALARKAVDAYAKLLAHFPPTVAPRPPPPVTIHSPKE